MSTKKKTTEQFIIDAHIAQGDKYIYTKVDYINQDTKVCIICPKHGEFWQKPRIHLRGHGCPECAKELLHKSKQNKNKKDYSKRTSIKKERFKPNRDYQKVNIKTNEDYIEYVTKLHNGKYDYKDTHFTRFKNKIKIICHEKDGNEVEHGVFEQTAYQHIIGHGCPKCAHKLSASKQKFTFNDFEKFANEKYNGKYLYERDDFVNMNTKMRMICKEHGEFWQTPNQHLKACGCVKCVSAHKRQMFAQTKEDFIRKANMVHHYKYIYDEVEYINNSIKVKIGCPKHGTFLCTPANHLKGRGCPICKAESFLYEDRLYRLLLENFDAKDIVRQYKAEWLSNNKTLDFFLPKYNIAIEHQGSQHFIPVKFLGGNEKHLRYKELDKEKYKECVKNKVKLFYFSYEKNTVPQTYLDKVYINEEDFINSIKNYLYEYKQ